MLLSLVLLVVVPSGLLGRRASTLHVSLEILFLELTQLFFLLFLLLFIGQVHFKLGLIDLLSR